MAYYDCDVELEEYDCLTCPDEREFGRVRSSALIHKSYLATLMADPTDAQLWQDGIDQGLIRIIPITAGSVDPGEPAQLKGYGDIKTYNGPREQTLNWFDPNYKNNYAFYNGMTNVKSWVPAYRTSSLVHIYDKVASLTAKDPVEDDIDSEVVWNCVAKVSSINLPSSHDASALESIFDCTA
jgi:hypothetical protein